jgi:hypothetical protein
MTLVMIHQHADNEEDFRIFPFATEEEREAQLAHDKEFFGDVKFFTAEMDDDGEITEKKKA